MKNEIDSINDSLKMINKLAGNDIFGATDSLVVLIGEEDFTCDLQQVVLEKDVAEELKTLLNECGIECIIRSLRGIKDQIRRARAMLKGGLSMRATCCLYVKITPRKIISLRDDIIACKQNGVMLELVNVS